MKDYLTIPLRERAALRAKSPENFKHFPAAVGGIWTREGDGSRFSFKVGRRQCTFIEEGEFRRFFNVADKIIRLRHTGWYTEHIGISGETTKGVVYRLSHDRFVAGASDPWNCDKRGEGRFIMENEVFDTPEEAALAADRLAELYGGFCREDNAQQTAEIHKEEAAEEIVRAKRSIRALVAGIREQVLHPTVCAEVAKAIRRYRGEIQEARARIHELEKNFWAAVE